MEGDFTKTTPGTLPINHLYAHNLAGFVFDVTQPFINPGFAKKLASKPNEMDTQLLTSSL